MLEFYVLRWSHKCSIRFLFAFLHKANFSKCLFMNFEGGVVSKSQNVRSMRKLRTTWEIMVSLLHRNSASLTRGPGPNRYNFSSSPAAFFFFFFGIKYATRSSVLKDLKVIVSLGDMVIRNTTFFFFLSTADYLVHDFPKLVHGEFN